MKIEIGERTYEAKLNKNALEGEPYHTKQAMIDAWFKDEKGIWREVKNWGTLSKLYDKIKIESIKEEAERKPFC